METDVRSDVNSSVPKEKLLEESPYTDFLAEYESVEPMESESEKKFITRHTNVRAMIKKCERLSANIGRTTGHIFAIV